MDINLFVFGMANVIVLNCAMLGFHLWKKDMLGSAVYILFIICQLFCCSYIFKTWDGTTESIIGIVGLVGAIVPGVDAVWCRLSLKNNIDKLYIVSPEKEVQEIFVNDEVKDIKILFGETTITIMKGESDDSYC